MRNHISVVSERKYTKTVRKENLYNHQKRSIAPMNCVFKMSEQFSQDLKNKLKLEKPVMSIKLQHQIDELQVYQHHPYSYLFEITQHQNSEIVGFSSKNQNQNYLEYQEERKINTDRKNGVFQSNSEHIKSAKGLFQTKNSGYHNETENGLNYSSSIKIHNLMKFSTRSLSTSSSQEQTAEKRINVSSNKVPTYMQNIKVNSQKIKLTKGLEIENTRKIANIFEVKHSNRQCHEGLKLKAHYNRILI